MTRDTTTDTQEHIGSLLQLYHKLDYRARLTFYDDHFGFIPFPFPDFDVRISWFTDKDKLCLLTHAFYGELRNHSLLETCCEERGERLLFNIKPCSLTQRIQYNQFLFSKFIVTDDAIKKSIASELTKTNDPMNFLRAKIQSVQYTLAWAKQVLQNKKTKFTLPHQFLKIVYAGINGYGAANDISGIRHRRRFVEAYLYAQGLFVAGYLHWLYFFLEEYRAS